MAAPSAPRDRRASRATCGGRAALRPGRTPDGNRTRCRPVRAGAAGRKPSSIARSTISSASSPARRFVLVERDLVLGEAAGRRAVEQAARRRPALPSACSTPGCRAPAAGRAAADDRLPRRPVLAGLVIGDRGVAGAVAARLDQVDRAAQDEAAVDQHRIRHAARIASPRPSARSANSKRRGTQPSDRGRRRTQTRRSRAMSGDLVAPDAIDRRRELFLVLASRPER